ncbi:MAG: arylsulfatase, partial [Sphingobacteriales bacterium]
YGFDKSKPVFGNLPADETAKGYGAEGRGNSRRQTYAAMVSNMDRNIGRILAALQEAGMEENTLVLFHSDNGAAPNEGGTSGPLRGLKFQEWDGGVRAPAIVRWPAAFPGSRRLEQVMGYIDIAPTIREIIGINTKPAQPYDGISMLSVWKGRTKSVDRSLYLGYGSIVTNRWKLVKADAGNEKMKAGEDLVFDMQKDPFEKTNLREANPGIYKKLAMEVAVFDSIRSAYEVPPYSEGRKNFKAPKDWKIE